MTDSEVAKVARVVSELNLKTGRGVWIRLDPASGMAFLMLGERKVLVPPPLPDAAAEDPEREDRRWTWALEMAHRTICEFAA